MVSVAGELRQNPAAGERVEQHGRIPAAHCAGTAGRPQRRHQKRSGRDRPGTLVEDGDWTAATAVDRLNVVGAANVADGVGRLDTGIAERVKVQFGGREGSATGARRARRRQERIDRAGGDGRWRIGVGDPSRPFASRSSGNGVRERQPANVALEYTRRRHRRHLGFSRRRPSRPHGQHTHQSPA